MNYVKTAILISAITALFIGAGLLIGGEAGMMIALVIALGLNFFAYWNSDKMVLRLYKARPVSRARAPELFDMVEDLSARAGIPRPKLYIIEDRQPNAFATGRNPANGAIAVTSGLVSLLSAEEVAGVVAHELAHIKNRDTLIMTITATLAGAISMLANFALFFGGNRNNPLGILGTLLVMILAPVAAMLVQMAISRTREYEADKIGGEICGNPKWLASALKRLEAGVTGIENRTAEQNPASASLFIVNPLSGARADKLFSTHPSTENRVFRLLQQAGGDRPEARVVKQGDMVGSTPYTAGSDMRQRDPKGPWV